MKVEIIEKANEWDLFVDSKWIMTKELIRDDIESIVDLLTNLRTTLDFELERK